MWHRAEFRGREDELVDLASAARVAKVTRAAVSNWRRRYEDFPAVVAAFPVAGDGADRQLIVLAEFEAWVAAFRAKPRTVRHGVRRGPGRPRAEVLADRIGVLERRGDRARGWLAEHEAGVVAAQAEIAACVRELAVARAALAREVEAADRARDTSL